MVQSAEWYQEMKIGPAWSNTFEDTIPRHQAGGREQRHPARSRRRSPSRFSTPRPCVSSPLTTAHWKWGGTPWTGQHGPSGFAATNDKRVFNTAAASRAGRMRPVRSRTSAKSRASAISSMPASKATTATVTRSSSTTSSMVRNVLETVSREGVDDHPFVQGFRQRAGSGARLSPMKRAPSPSPRIARNPPMVSASPLPAASF